MCNDICTCTPMVYLFYCWRNGPFTIQPLQLMVLGGFASSPEPKNRASGGLTLWFHQTWLAGKSPMNGGF